MDVPIKNGDVPQLCNSHYHRFGERQGFSSVGSTLWAGPMWDRKWTLDQDTLQLDGWETPSSSNWLPFK